MSNQQKLIIAIVIILFIFAKGWILTHPKSMMGIIIGALLLIVTESTEAH